MARVLYTCLCLCVFSGVCHGVSTKMDFGEEEDKPVIIENNSTKVGDDDVEVKHTIVVSTRLKNSNRRGLQSSSDGGSGDTYNVGRRETKDDSGEVPVVSGYKAVESTLIRTPDTRFKHQPGISVIPESVYMNRNVHDEYDTYPNYVNIPNQWKPSTLYNNINWYNQEVPINRAPNPTFKSTFDRRPAYQTPGKFHRRISDDGMKEFYCNRCRELRGLTDCGQQRSNAWSYVQTTTPKIKLDGKLAKLN